MSKRTSSRKNVWPTFDPSKDPSLYRSDNILRFVRKAGQLQRFKDEEDALKDRLKAESGINQGDKIAMRRFASSREYRRALEQFRFNFVQQLGPQFWNLDQTEMGVSASLSGMLTKKDVEDQFNSMSPEQFRNWVMSLSPSAFRTNALELAAQKLEIGGRTSETKGLSGDDKKIVLHDLISGRITHAPRTKQFSSGIVSGDQARQVLTRYGITSSGQLMAQRLPELRQFAREAGVKSSGKKAEVVNALAMAAGFDSLRSIDEISQDIEAIIAMAQVNQSDAIAAARALSPDEIERVSATLAVRLWQALNLRAMMPDFKGTPSRTKVVQALFGESRPSSFATARQHRIGLRTDLNVCNNASRFDVVQAAKALGIPHLNVPQGEICEKIYTHHSVGASQLLLEEGVDVMALRRLNPQQLASELSNISFRLKLSLPNTVDELVQYWLKKHYEGRSTLRPGSLNMVRNFINNGIVPSDRGQLYNLAVIFSDIEPSLQDADSSAISSILSTLYENYIKVIQQGGTPAAQAWTSRSNRYSFSHAPVSRSPVSRVPLGLPSPGRRPSSRSTSPTGLSPRRPSSRSTSPTGRSPRRPSSRSTSPTGRPMFSSRRAPSGVKF